MAWTQTDIDNLKAAIGRGATRVRNANHEEVEYQSIDQMRKALSAMEAEVGGRARNAIGVIYPTTSRGL
ncbi:MAG: phage head-tail joining protein [Cypionkella sp.]